MWLDVVLYKFTEVFGENATPIFKVFPTVGNRKFLGSAFTLLPNYRVFLRRRQYAIFSQPWKTRTACKTSVRKYKVRKLLRGLFCDVKLTVHFRLIRRWRLSAAVYSLPYMACIVTTFCYNEHISTTYK